MPDSPDLLNSAEALLSQNSTNETRRRIKPPSPWFLLPVGLLIAFLCWQRIVFNRPFVAGEGNRTVWMPAPLFTGFDAYNQMMRLERYMGRHRVIVCFVSLNRGLEDWNDLALLTQKFPDLTRQDIKIVAVTNGLPQQCRAAMEQHGRLPFPLVSDVLNIQQPQQPGPSLQIHAAWGLLDSRADPPRVREGVFLIDRRGFVKFQEGVPLPESSVSELLKEVLK